MFSFSNVKSICHNINRPKKKKARKVITDKKNVREDKKLETIADTNKEKDN